MINFNRGFGLLRAIALGLLVGLVFLLDVPALNAFALPFTPLSSNTYIATDLTEEDSQVAHERKKRIEAVVDCRQYLTKGNNDTAARTDAPLDAVGSKRFVGALKATDNPQTTPAEVAFKRCLEQKGVAPKTGETPESVE